MALALPPWGKMVGAYHDGATRRPAPKKWNAEPAAWDAWFDNVLTLLGQNVWPIYKDGSWQDCPAAHDAIDLTRADLIAMREFRRLHNLATVGTTGLYQWDIYVVEDERSGSGWAPSIARYCPELANPIFNLDKIFEHAIYEYAGEYLALAFKLHLQRPRPYQTSLLLEGDTSFRYDGATSAHTPSIISGHGVQGLIVGCVAFESISSDKELTKRNVDGLQAWMTGIGDRRVMAGVHYPTDSLASWIVAAELVDYIFENPAIREFLLGAIQKSLLYKFLEARVPTTPPYARPWECLRATLKKSSSRAGPGTASGTSDRSPRPQATSARPG